MDDSLQVTFCLDLKSTVRNIQTKHYINFYIYFSTLSTTKKIGHKWHEWKEYLLYVPDLCKFKRHEENKQLITTVFTY
jgi:hypothetical protein